MDEGERLVMRQGHREQARVKGKDILKELRKGNRGRDEGRSRQMKRNEQRKVRLV